MPYSIRSIRYDALDFMAQQAFHLMTALQDVNTPESAELIVHLQGLLSKPGHIQAEQFDINDPGSIAYKIDQQLELAIHAAADHEERRKLQAQRDRLRNELQSAVRIYKEAPVIHKKQEHEESAGRHYDPFTRDALGSPSAVTGIARLNTDIKERKDSIGTVDHQGNFKRKKGEAAQDFAGRIIASGQPPRPVELYGFNKEDRLIVVDTLLANGVPLKWPEARGKDMFNDPRYAINKVLLQMDNAKDQPSNDTTNPDEVIAKINGFPTKPPNPNGMTEKQKNNALAHYQKITGKYITKDSQPTVVDGETRAWLHKYEVEAQYDLLQAEQAYRAALQVRDEALAAVEAMQPGAPEVEVAAAEARIQQANAELEQANSGLLQIRRAITELHAAYNDAVGAGKADNLLNKMQQQADYVMDLRNSVKAYSERAKNILDGVELQPEPEPIPPLNQPEYAIEAHQGIEEDLRSARAAADNARRYAEQAARDFQELQGMQGELIDHGADAAQVNEVITAAQQAIGDAVAARQQAEQDVVVIQQQRRELQVLIGARADGNWQDVDKQRLAAMEDRCATALERVRGAETVAKNAANYVEEQHKRAQEALQQPAEQAIEPFEPGQGAGRRPEGVEPQPWFDPAPENAGLEGAAPPPPVAGVPFPEAQPQAAFPDQAAAAVAAPVAGGEAVDEVVAEPGGAAAPEGEQLELAEAEGAQRAEGEVAEVVVEQIEGAGVVAEHQPAHEPGAGVIGEAQQPAAGEDIVGIIHGAPPEEGEEEHILEFAAVVAQPAAAPQEGAPLPAAAQPQQEEELLVIPGAPRVQVDLPLVLEPEVPVAAEGMPAAAPIDLAVPFRLAPAAIPAVNNLAAFNERIKLDNDHNRDLAWPVYHFDHPPLVIEMGNAEHQERRNQEDPVNIKDNNLYVCCQLEEANGPMVVFDAFDYQEQLRLGQNHNNVPGMFVDIGNARYPADKIFVVRGNILRQALNQRNIVPNLADVDPEDLGWNPPVAPVVAQQPAPVGALNPLFHIDAAMADPALEPEGLGEGGEPGAEPAVAHAAGEPEAPVAEAGELGEEEDEFALAAAAILENQLGQHPDGEPGVELGAPPDNLVPVAQAAAAMGIRVPHEAKGAAASEPAAEIDMQAAQQHVNQAVQRIQAAAVTTGRVYQQALAAQQQSPNNLIIAEAFATARTTNELAQMAMAEANAAHAQLTQNPQQAIAAAEHQAATARAAAEIAADVPQQIAAAQQAMGQPVRPELRPEMKGGVIPRPVVRPEEKKQQEAKLAAAPMPNHPRPAMQEQRFGFGAEFVEAFNHQAMLAARAADQKQERGPIVRLGGGDDE